MPVLDQIARHKILPVIALEDSSRAGALADALVGGGLPVAEVTFRTSSAAESIRTIANRGDVLVGAGTVLTPDQAKRAVDAGAKFIVSPGFHPRVVAYCVENAIPVTPGVATPTDIGHALEAGLSVVKFFPAEAIGGLKLLKALAAPFGGIKFIPTGGISAANLADYLALKAVLACGGSWMVEKSLLDAGKFDEVVRLTTEAVAIAARAANR